MREVNQGTNTNQGGKLQLGKIVNSKVAFYDWTAGMFSRQARRDRGRRLETGWPETALCQPEQVSAGPAADIDNCCPWL
jgi:hypothetical protein